jgi:hypothetical protein
MNPAAERSQLINRVSEPLATPFGSRTAKLQPMSEFGAGYGGYTSFVQYRGSIPVTWHQESTQLTARPPIESELRRADFLATTY